MAFAESAVVPDVAAVSAPLPEGVAPRTLVVSVGGPVNRMRARRALIEEEVAAWLERVASTCIAPSDAIAETRERGRAHA
jgi:hypothetical protein